MSETNGNGAAESRVEEAAIELTAEEIQKIKEENSALKSTVGSLKREVKGLKRDKDGDDKETLQETPNLPDETLKRLERLELGNLGYNSEQVDEIMKLGGTKALDNEVIKAGIETKFKKADVKKNSQVIASVSSSEGTKEVTADDFKGMSSKDMEKYLPKSS